jgi:hypothetical protein
MNDFPRLNHLTLSGVDDVCLQQELVPFLQSPPEGRLAVPPLALPQVRG